MPIDQVTTLYYNIDNTAIIAELPDRFSIVIVSKIGSEPHHDINSNEGQSDSHRIITKKLADTRHTCHDSEPCNKNTILLPFFSSTDRKDEMLTTHDYNNTDNNEWNKSKVPYADCIKVSYKCTQTDDVEENGHCMYVSR